MYCFMRIITVNIVILMGFSSLVQPPSSSLLMKHNRMIVGSQSCLDPYYLKTVLSSEKHDIKSLCVIFLELITGIEAFCAENGHILTTITDPML